MGFALLFLFGLCYVCLVIVTVVTHQSSTMSLNTTAVAYWTLVSMYESYETVKETITLTLSVQIAIVVKR